MRLPDPPRRADYLGAAFILALALVTFGLASVMVHAPLVALCIVAVVVVVYAGHIIGDELETLVREWVTRRTGSDDGPRPPESDPVSERRAARLRHPSAYRTRGGIK